MGLNSLSYPFQYEDHTARIDPRTTLDTELFGKQLNPESHFEGIIGRSSVLRRVLRMVETVAGGDSSVLLLGETGTGKELVARAIHRHSCRRNRPFVRLNCAAIPTGLLERELFGHERGSFTGAIAQKIGRLELAHQGSLFLDEIGDRLSLPAVVCSVWHRSSVQTDFEAALGKHRSRQRALSCFRCWL